MKSMVLFISALIFLFSATSQSIAECRSFSSVAYSQDKLEARYLAKVRRNQKAINVYGRSRMCGYARHTEMCNRYIQQNVTCRIGRRINRTEPEYRCLATGRVCSVNRGRRPLLDGPEGFIGPFIPFLQKKRKGKRRKYRRERFKEKQYQQ